MHQYIITNPPPDIRVGYYDFSNSSGYNADGTFIVRADTHAHLLQILTDIEEAIVPEPPPPPPTETEIMLAELAQQLLNTEQALIDNQAVLSEVVLVLFESGALNA